MVGIIVGCSIVAVAVAAALAPLLLLWLIVSSLSRDYHHEGFVFISRSAAADDWYDMHADSGMRVFKGEVIHDDRVQCKIVVDRVLATARELYHGLGQVPFRLGLRTFPQSLDGSNGLVVLVHGLRGHPSALRHYIPEIRRRRPDMRIEVPSVPQTGACALEVAAAPVLEMVRAHVREYGPSSPVVLVGHSNGSRVVAHVERHLRDIPSCIHIVTVGGPFRGSDAMRLVDTLPQCLQDRVIPRELGRELRANSAFSRRLLEDIDAPLPEDVTRTYLMTGTLEEHNVWPPVSAFPIFKHIPVERAYVTAEGHSSIIKRVIPLVMDRLLPQQ